VRGRCLVTLSEREEEEFQRLARGLEQDDPGFARRFRRRSRRRFGSPAALGFLCVAAIVFGLGVTAVAAQLGSSGYAAAGVAFATGAPIFIAFRWNTRHH
jgi:DUF3040 family protein